MTLEAFYEKTGWPLTPAHPSPSLPAASEYEGLSTAPCRNKAGGVGEEAAGAASTPNRGASHGFNAENLKRPNFA